MIMENGLWYVYENQNGQTSVTLKTPKKRSYEVVRRLSKAAEYELWHQQLRHPGHMVMDII